MPNRTQAETPARASRGSVATPRPMTASHKKFFGGERMDIKKALSRIMCDADVKSKLKKIEHGDAVFIETSAKTAQGRARALNHAFGDDIYTADDMREGCGLMFGDGWILWEVL